MSSMCAIRDKLKVESSSFELSAEDLAILNSLSDYQKECVFGEYQACLAGWRDHRWYAKYLVYSVSSMFWRLVFGRKDKLIRALLMERITANFSVKDGTTQAWVWRPEVIELIESWHSCVQKSTRKKGKKDTEVKTVTLNKRVLEREAANGCLKSKAFLAKGHHAGDDFIVVHEHYGRAGDEETGRQFVRGFGLQQCSNEYRKMVVYGTNTVSVDISNCNPTIMDQMVTFDAPAIRQLATDRESVYSLLSQGFGWNRSASKVWALAMSAGASLSGPTFTSLRQPATPLTCTDPEKTEAAIEFCQQFKAEVYRLACETCERLGVAPDGREKFSVLTKEIQRIEDSALMTAQKYHARRGEEVSVLIFDGYFVRGLEAIDHVDLDDLSAFVYSKTGFSFRFSQLAVDGEISDGNCLTLAA